jgi:hypothetical protein
MGGFDWTGTLAPWGEEGTPRLDDDGRVVVRIATDDMVRSVVAGLDEEG